MNELETIALGTMKNDETYAFHKAVAGFAAEIQVEQTKTLAAAYMKAYQTFRDAVEKPSGPSTAKAARDADDARDLSWRGSHEYIKAVAIFSPQPQVKAAAEKIYSLFERYGNALKLSTAEETTMLENLIDSVEGLGEDTLNACHFAPWIADLKTKQADYEAAAKENIVENAGKVLGAVRTARAACNDAYNALASTMKALILLNSETGFETFIKNTNEVINRQKAIIKTRNTKRNSSSRSE